MILNSSYIYEQYFAARRQHLLRITNAANTLRVPNTDKKETMNVSAAGGQMVIVIQTRGNGPPTGVMCYTRASNTR